MKNTNRKLIGEFNAVENAKGHGVSKLTRFFQTGVSHFFSSRNVCLGLSCTPG